MGVICALLLQNYVADENPACRKINKSPMTVEDPALLKVHLTKPPVKRIDLHFPLGMEVTARNLKGVTIKDALDAIHKPYKKRVCSFRLEASRGACPNSLSPMF